MLSIEWIGLIAATTFVALLTSITMYLWRARYIHGKVHSSQFQFSLPDQEYEAQDEESDGCVSLLATVVGILSMAVTGIGSLVLLYQFVVVGSILLVDTILPATALLYGVLLLAFIVFLVAFAVISFGTDLLNPPR